MPGHPAMSVGLAPTGIGVPGERVVSGMGVSVSVWKSATKAVGPPVPTEETKTSAGSCPAGIGDPATRAGRSMGVTVPSS